MSNAQTYQCPNCNGVMSFDPTTGKICCEYCGHVFEEGEAEAAIPLSDTPVERHATTHAESVEDFLERAPWEIEANGSVNAMMYTCPSCAAEIAADQSTVSTSCPYCGNNMLVSGLASEENIPQWVLPFSVTKEQAEERMRAHFEHKWYLSRQFNASLEHMQGMYIPYHLYDVHVAGSADYIGYENETTEDADGNSHTERYYYAVRRGGYANFNKIPETGSSKMPHGHMDAISPFSFDKLRDFSASYAAGYLMEVADEDAQSCQPRAENRARTSFESDLKRDASRERGVDGIDETVHQDTRVQVTDISSCVLPVWMMHCTWNNEQMLFAVNGETGKCVGDLPVDGKRRATTVMVTLIVAIIIAVLLRGMVVNDGDSSLPYFGIAAVLIIVATVGVDAIFMGQMRTAVEAKDASMSYTTEGLVVTDRWRSSRRTSSKGKARNWLE